MRSPRIHANRGIPATSAMRAFDGPTWSVSIAIAPVYPSKTARTRSPSLDPDGIGTLTSPSARVVE